MSTNKTPKYELDEVVSVNIVVKPALKAFSNIRHHMMLDGIIRAVKTTKDAKEYYHVYDVYIENAELFERVPECDIYSSDSVAIKLDSLRNAWKEKSNA